MANNCLNTELDCVINNNSIPFLGYKKIYIKAVQDASTKSNAIRYDASLKVDGKIKLIGENLYFADSSLVSTGSKEFTGSSNPIWTNNNGVMLISPNVQQIQSLASATGVVKSYYLNLDEYSDVTTLTALVIQNSINSYGNILSLARNIELSSLIIPNCPLITGYIKDFAIKQIDSYERTSGTLNLTSNGTVRVDEEHGTANNSTYKITYVSSTEFTVLAQSASITYTFQKIDGVWTLVE